MSLVRLSCNSWGLTDEQRKQFSAIWPALGGDDKYPNIEEQIIDIDELPDWVSESDKITIKPLKKITFSKPEPRFTTGNIPEVKEFIKTVNQIVMPGFELLRYAAIDYFTDCCTEEIQKSLDKGWRIIAVLPQPNQRRPDYILVRECKP